MSPAAQVFAATRRPFGDGPSSREPWGDPVPASNVVRLAVPSGAALHRGTRTLGPEVGELCSPSPKGRHFIEVSTSPTLTDRISPCSPPLRGRPFIEAITTRLTRASNWRSLAAPSGTALHRGSNSLTSRRQRASTRRPFGDGPSSRRQIPHARGHLLATRRPLGDGPSSRRVSERETGRQGPLAFPSGTAVHRGMENTGRYYYQIKLAAPSGTALHRGAKQVNVSSSCLAARRPFGTALHRGLPSLHTRASNWPSPPLRGRPFIEAGLVRRF